MEFVLYIGVSNYLVPMSLGLFGPDEFGYRLVCVVLLGTFGDALDARLTHKEGVVTMCILESS